MITIRFRNGGVLECSDDQEPALREFIRLEAVSKSIGKMYADDLITNIEMFPLTMKVAGSRNNLMKTTGAIGELFNNFNFKQKEFIILDSDNSVLYMTNDDMLNDYY
jgi:hypothetical protein